MENRTTDRTTSEDISSSISRLLSDLIRTIKVVAVYPDDNPIPTRLKESFVERFTNLVRDTGGLQFSITQDEIRHIGKLVYKDKSADDSLAGLFHSSGITDISFSAAFGYDETNRFFKTIKSFVNKEQGSEDLVALLWQAEIAGFNYKTVEDLALREYDGEFSVLESTEEDNSFVRHTSSDDSGKVQYAAIFLDDDESRPVENAEGTSLCELSGSAASPGAASIRRDDVAEKAMGLVPVLSQQTKSLPDTAIIFNEAYSLGECDLGRVGKILQEDEECDFYKRTSDLLLEILDQEKEFPEFSETIMVMEKMQTEFLRQGNLTAAGEILSLFHQIMEQSRNRSPHFAGRIRDALIFAGGHEKLSYLGETLNGNSAIAAQEIETYLSHFGWEAIGTICDLLGTLEYRSHRESICEYLVQYGKQHVAIISKGIFDRRWFVVRNTASILARIGGNDPFPYLEKALAHQDPRVRLQVVKGISENQNEKSINLLTKSVWDSDDLVRQTALRAILDHQGQAGLEFIVGIINDERFASLSESYQEELIMTLSKLGGEHAVSYLVSLVTSGGFFKSQVKEFYRRIAFKALICNRSEKAKKALLKLAHSWRMDIRKMAKEALLLRRESTYMSK